MEQQRHRSGGGRRRRRNKRSTEQRAPVEPVLIAARRPNSPLVARAPAAISAAPKPARSSEAKKRLDNGKPVRAEAEPVQRRTARIVQVTRTDTDAEERERLRLLDRLMAAETRGAISRTAEDYVKAGFAFPEEQPVQLQLLEHFDEEHARDAISTLTRLIGQEAPFKRPVLEQRLRRLEEYADEPQTREAAAELRRAIRV